MASLWWSILEFSFHENNFHILTGTDIPEETDVAELLGRNDPLSIELICDNLIFDIVKKLIQMIGE